MFYEHSCDKMYNLPDIKTTRTTSLGYGKKVDFSKMGPNSPAPNTYNRGSTFDSKQGYSFRLNREVTIMEKKITTKHSANCKLFLFLHKNV